MKTYETKKAFEDDESPGWNVVVPFTHRETARNSAVEIEKETGYMAAVVPCSDTVRRIQIRNKNCEQKKVRVSVIILVNGVLLDGPIDTSRWVDAKKYIGVGEAFDIVADSLDYILKDDAVEYVCDNLCGDDR